MTRYLVTGCAGFIGSHLTDALLARGDEVVGIDALTDYYPRAAKRRNLRAALSQDNFSLVEADLSVAPLNRLFENIDCVFHLAGQPGVRGSWGDSFGYYLRDNLLASQRVFEAAVGAGTRVVFASSSSVYGDAECLPTPEEVEPRPVSPYGVTKLGCEHLAGTYAASGLEAVCLRYFSVYGPRQRPDMAFARIIESLENGHPFTVLGSGAQVRDFTYVGDVVEATIDCMEQAPAGATYNVGGGTPTSLRTAIGICERVSGRTLNTRYVRAARGDPKRTAADTSRIRREIGWTPSMSLAEGLAAQLAAASRKVLAAA